MFIYEVEKISCNVCLTFPAKWGVEPNDALPIYTTGGRFIPPRLLYLAIILQYLSVYCLEIVLFGALRKPVH